MSVGRKVADAYIDVHGSTEKFRKSLSKAAKQGRDAGREAAGEFFEGWAKKSEQDFSKKWDATLSALYSNNKLDWKRLVGTFDADNFDDAAKKVTKFMQTQLSAGKMTKDQYADAAASIRSQLKLLQEEEDAVRRTEEEKAKHRKERLADEEKLRWALAANYREQERYKKSFEGMFRSGQLAAMEADWRRITDAMQKADWSKFTKGEQDLAKVRGRIRDIVDEMHSLGRVTEDNGQRIIASIDEHVTAEQRRQRAIKETEAATAEADEATKRWKRSLSGMMFNAELRDLEESFTRLSRAMATDNWAPVARGKKDMGEFADHVRDTAEQMRNMGRVNNEEFDRINTKLRTVLSASADFNVSLGDSNRRMDVFGKLSDSAAKGWRRMDGTVKLVLYAILAAAGPIATMLSGLSASAVSIVSSLATAAATVVPLAATAGAFAAAIFLAVSSFDGIKARLPGIQQSLTSIAETWRAQAENFGLAWGDSLDGLLSSFSAKFAAFDIGTPLGTAFADMTRAFTDVVNGPAFNALMEAMTTDLPAAVSGLGRGFAGLFSGLNSLMAGSAPVAKLLGEDFARWGTNIAASLEKARESGKLNEVFEKARESLLAVLDLTGSIGGALGTMFMIGADTGNSLLGSLTKIVDKFNAWMQTDEGRAKMLEWFERGADIVRSFEPLAVGLGKALDTLVTPKSIAQVADLMEGLGELLPTLGELLSAVSDLGVLNILTDLLNLVGDLIKPLLPAFSEFAGIIGDSLQGALEEMSPLFSEVGEALVPVMELIAELARDILPPLVPLIGEVVQAVIKVIPVLAEVLGFAADFLILVGDIVGAILELEGIGTIIESLGTMVEGAVNLMVGLLTGDWDRAWSGAGQVMEGFGGVFVGVWETIQGLYDIFVETTEGLRITFETIFGAIGTFFSDTWNNVSTFAQDTWNNLTTFFSDTWNNISTTVSDAWNGMTETIGTFLSDTDTNIREKLDGFWTKFDEVFPGTRALAEEEWGKMKDSISDLVNVTKNNIDERWTEMKENASTKFNEIKSTTETVWGQISEATKTKWEEIKKDVTDRANEMVQPVKDKWEEIRKSTSDKWGEIKDKVSTKWDEMLRKTGETSSNMSQKAGELGSTVRERVMGPINHLRGEWDRGWNMIQQVFSLTWQRIKNGAIEGAQNVMNWIIQLPGRIMNALFALPGQMRDMGVNMMLGMAGGVGAAAQNIVNSAVAAANDAVAAVRNFLGIASPSRVFIGIGEFMGEGMVIGMDSAAGKVAASASSLAEAASGEFAVDRMYATGRDAALGLAEGLASSKDVLRGALGDLSTGEFATRVHTPARPGHDAEEVPDSGRTVRVEAGAIRIETKTADPELAAEMVLDGLINNVNL